MARTDLLNIIYAQKKNIADFDWDALTAPPIANLLTPYDIQMIEDICRDPRLHSKTREKKKYIDGIMISRGFKRFASGTNRVVYKFLEDQRFLLKAAISRPGINDSRMEWFNQFKLRPYCAKCYEASPSGILGLFERVETINNLQEYINVADDHFKLLNDKIIGKYVMADVGTRFWMNLGIRLGFGLVFIDYPLLYELDGNKLFCSNKDPFTGLPCGGQIDYDDGFNFLFCSKCGKQYLASKLAKNDFEGIKIVKKGDLKTMKFRFKYNGKVYENDTSQTSNSYMDDIKKKQERRDRRKKKSGNGFTLKVDQEALDRIYKKEIVESDQAQTESGQNASPTITINNTNSINQPTPSPAPQQQKAEEPPKSVPEPNNENVQNTEESSTKEPVEPYKPEPKLHAPYPATRPQNNMTMNMEDDEEEENPSNPDDGNEDNKKGYPAKKKKSRKNRLDHY